MGADQTKATALLIAERELKRLGWKHTPEKIGEVAAEIIAAMNKKLSKDSPRD